MKQVVAALLAVAILFGLLKLFTRWDLSRNALPDGSPVAAFTLPDSAGRPFRLPVADKAVLVNYWASWCGPCLEEMPILREFARRNGANSTQLVTIALEDERSSRPWLQANPQPFPVLMESPGEKDSSVAMGNSRGILPYFVLLGPDGRVRASHTGAFGSLVELDAWIADAR